MKKTILGLVESFALASSLLIPFALIVFQDVGFLTVVGIAYASCILSFLNLVDLSEYKGLEEDHSEEGQIDKSLLFIKIYFCSIAVPLITYILIFAGGNGLVLKTFLFLASAIVFSIAMTCITSVNMTDVQLTFKEQKEKIQFLLEECRENGVLIKNADEVFLIWQLINSYEELNKQEKIENYEFTKDSIKKVMLSLEKALLVKKEKNEILNKIEKIEKESV